MLLASILVLVTSGTAVQPERRYLWVVRDALRTTEEIDRLLDRALIAGASGLVVQVVGRGEAYYDSDLLPPADFTGCEDPLGYLAFRARPMGLEVHAWVNAFLVWSAPRMPADPSHVVLAHPQWLMTDREGRSTLDYSPQEREAAGLVGATLSPAEPGVRELLGGVAAELAAGYDLDGIHLDYIRYPGGSFGFEPRARALFVFHRGVDPAGSGRSRYSISDEDAAEWSRWRSAMVTQTVETVSAAVRRVDPFLELSAAVIADPWAAEGSFSCPWRDWLRSGLIDMAYPMAYAADPESAQRLARMDTAVRPENVIYGIACYNQTVTEAWPAAATALENGAAGICVFSLNSLESQEALTLQQLWRGGDGTESMPTAAFHRVWKEPGPL